VSTSVPTALIKLAASNESLMKRIIQELQKKEQNG